MQRTMCIADKQYRIIGWSKKLDQIDAAAAVNEDENVTIVFVAVEGALEFFHAHPGKRIEVDVNFKFAEQIADS